MRCAMGAMPWLGQYMRDAKKNRAVFWQIFGWWKDEIQPDLIMCVFRFMILDKKDKTFVYFNKALFFIC